MLKNLWSKFRQSPIGEKIRSLIPDSIVNLLEHLSLAVIATIYYRYPAKNLVVIGVTGTDGKTTTATLIYEILQKAGKKVALVSTVSAKIGKEEIESGFHVTSPHPWKLQKLLRKVVDSGFKYIVLESTSHGLIQHRLFGCNFKVGVITNVTHEHLDYHKTYENYLAAKTKLFRRVKIAVLNRDDQSYDFLMSKLQSFKVTKVITYGIKKTADFTPKTFPFKTKLPGEYNQYNCLAAISVASSLGISGEKIRKAIASFKGVTGRMEEVKEGQNFQFFVDFAHTPNALEQILQYLSQKKKKRLIVIFGCAGLRDRTKRPIMGEIASRFADIVILTAEDPRTEDVNKIIDQIAKGCQKAGGKERKTFFRVPDRKEAFKFAVSLAKKDDIVVACGKGPEKSMCFGTTEYPWSEQEEVRKALKTKK